MKRLELSVLADADLFDILAYGTAVHGSAVSDAYYLGLMEAFDFLCTYPQAAPVDENTTLGLRRWRYGQHHVFYREDEETVLVIRIFHVAADAVKWLVD